MSRRFAGSVALVTGAASGIGAATAAALAREGAHVAVNHLGRPDDAAGVVAAIRAGGGVAEAVEADVSDGRQVAAMVSAVERALGPVDVLVNNAGVLSRSACVDLDEAEWDLVLGVNLKAAYLCSKHALPAMIARRRGKIVNVSSDLAYTGEALLVHYCAAKGGLISLSRALAREVIGYGINVNAVAPGMIETPMLTANPVTFNEERRRSIPAGRWGRPDDVAATICFLASAEASYYVGWVLSPNGGIVM
jgi:NAD(P)-dependent dehydrogenase (short-subunit alcohol dehydrogenase family)